MEHTPSMHSSISAVNRAWQRRRVLTFAAVTLASGWIGIAVQQRVGTDAPQTGLALWLLAPCATAMVLRAFGDGWTDAGLKPALRGNGVGYAVAVLLHPLGALVTVALGAAAGWLWLADFSWSALLGVIAGGVAPALLKNVFEEFAWRGYLTPKLAALGFGDLANHAIVAAVWTGWHLPYFCFLLDRNALHAATSLDLGAFIALAVPSLLAMSIVYGELRLLTGSVWPAVIAHALGNATLDVLVAGGFVRVDAAMETLASPGYQGLGTIAFCAAAGLLLRRWRLSHAR